MNLYLDTSALVKRYFDEEGSEAVKAAMDEADHWTASQITYVETLRALSSGPAPLTKRARKDWDELNAIEVDQPLCERAVVLAGRHRLRSLDAIHLASALIMATDDLTFATWDRRLHAAAVAEGLTTLPVSLS